MNFEILKKAFPQDVINSLFGLLFIFAFALIYSLHATAADEPQEITLDWTAPGFMQKLTKACPQLQKQELGVFDIALKFAKNADDYREDFQQKYKRSLEYGKSAEEARKHAEFFTFNLPVSIGGPWRMETSPRPVFDVSDDEREAWNQELKRFQSERKQLFIANLIKRCQPLPPAILEKAYKFTLNSEFKMTASNVVLDWTAPEFITALTRECLLLPFYLHIVLRLVKREELRGDVWTKREKPPFPWNVRVDESAGWYERQKKVEDERKQGFAEKLTTGCPQIQLPSDALERVYEKAYPSPAIPFY